MQMPKLHPSSTEAESMGLEPRNLHLSRIRQERARRENNDGIRKSLRAMPFPPEVFQNEAGKKTAAKRQRGRKPDRRENIKRSGSTAGSADGGNGCGQKLDGSGVEDHKAA